jgi:hypothetical protein
VDDPVEKVLRSSRPEPDPEFVRSLHQRLFRPRRDRRPVLAGAAFAGALASAALALSLAGVGPLAGGGRGAQAGSACKFVTVTRVEQTPVLVQHSGTSALAFKAQAVKRRVKHCS